MKKYLLLIFVLMLVGCQTSKNQSTTVLSDEPHKETTIEDDTTIRFLSLDGLPITADLYFIDETSPIFLLYHRAGWSRGEYKETALKLNDYGYNAIAFDLRSGLLCNDVTNETAQIASEMNYKKNHVDAGNDIIASIEYVYEQYDNDIYLLGSSYSASLLLVLNELYTQQVKGIFAFSPGEYFPYDGQTIAHHAKQLTQPVFVTSASFETDEWETIFDAIGSENKFAFYPQAFGEHGSESLWSTTEGHSEYWEAMLLFLDMIKETDI